MTALAALLFEARWVQIVCALLQLAAALAAFPEFVMTFNRGG